MPVELVRPAIEHLDSYVDALQRGWSPADTVPSLADAERERIANGGVLVEEFTKPPAAGGGPALRFHIPMD